MTHLHETVYACTRMRFNEMATTALLPRVGIM